MIYFDQENGVHLVYRRRIYNYHLQRVTIIRKDRWTIYINEDSYRTLPVWNLGPVEESLGFVEGSAKPAPIFLQNVRPYKIQGHCTLIPEEGVLPSIRNPIDISRRVGTFF